MRQTTRNYAQYSEKKVFVGSMMARSEAEYFGRISHSANCRYTTASTTQVPLKCERLSSLS